MSDEREPWHGTAGGYTNHRCRCDDCRAANTEKQRQWRRDPAKYARQLEVNRLSWNRAARRV